MRITSFLLPLSILLIAGYETHATALIDTRFGEKVVPIEGNENASGVLPEGVIEDSEWADLQIEYSKDVDTLGGLLTWIHADLTELKNGRAQLKWPIPSPEEPTHYRFEANLGSPTKSLMRLVVMRNGPPYNVYWEKSFIPQVARQNYSFDFQLPKIEHPISVLLTMEQVGQYDLATLTLERRSSKDVEESRVAAIAAAPDNLAPNAGFALGLPSAWGTKRIHSIKDRVRLRPAEQAGPHGTIPLQIDVETDGQEYTLHSAPFSVPDPESIYILSFIATGTSEGNVNIYSDGATTGSGTFAAAPEGALIKIPFRTKELAKWNVIEWTGNEDVQIDALNVSLGRKAKPFSLPGELEVALAADFAKGNVFVEGVDAPEIRFAVTGLVTDGVALRTRTYNLYDQSIDSLPLEISAKASTGTIQPVSPDTDRIYGSYRFEAWAERDGERISPISEVVYHVVPKPVYWGEIAPQSRFGHHLNAYEPHLYAMKAIGSNWSRFHARPGYHTTYWSAVEPNKGEWTWNDDEINRYREAGFATMGVLTRVPAWARVERAEERYNGWLDNWWQPRDYAEYAEYVERAVNHHKENIDAWMGWNEPWGGFWFKEWRPDLGPVEQWHKGNTPLVDHDALSRVAWEAYQRTGSDKPFLTINGTLGTKGKKWMRDSIEIGTHLYGNGISYHAYFGGDINNVINNNSGMMQNLQRRVFDPIEENEEASKLPVWMTEGSWLLEDWGTGLHYHSVPGSKDLLQNVREIAVRVPLYHVAQLEHGVEKVFTYAINAGPNFYRPTGNGVHNWGFMATQAGELHPSGVAYAAMAKRLETSAFNRRIQIDDNTAAFVFDNEEGSLMALFGFNTLNGYLKAFTARGLNVDDFLGNPATEGIEHKLLYVELDDGSDAEALLGLP